jgi:hypothetical protein
MKEKYILRIWIYRLCVALVCGLMIFSFALPWWKANQISVDAIMSGGFYANGIIIYGFGLRHNLTDLESYFISEKTPLFQTILAWVYLAVSICLALLSVKLKGIKGTLLLGLVGLGYIIYAVVAGFAVISPGLASYGFALQGSSTTTYSGAIVKMEAAFTPGYYLTYIAGILFLVLAIIHYSLTRPKNLD